MVIDVVTGKCVINRVVKFSWTVTVLAKVVWSLLRSFITMEELDKSFLINVKCERKR